MSNALKNAYHNIILPYEEYLANHKLSAPTGTAVAGTKREASTDSSLDQDALATPAASPPSNDSLFSPSTRRSKRLKKEPHGSKMSPR